ncbi:MAG TPA: prepilin-type N-terminal cleavage/methylation domain-containing protein [Methylomirabilota bacterium]|jgi:prepilin-type N-terminal cleavage/methylation domain-containing protein|nr:prepilin-type N-terminal cleavage/methylation domain-containing protein [Methylomirabilota bacterium]
MRHHVGSPLRDQRGVTLTELAVTLALFGMIMVGVLGTWQKTQEAYFVGSDAAEVQQNTRAAIDFMVRELRATGRDVTVCAFDYEGPGTLDCTATKVDACRNAPKNLGAGGYTANGCQSIFAIPFADATATTIRVRSDRNDNGTIAGTANSGGTDLGEENVLYQRETGGNCPTGVAACITRDDGTGPVAMVAIDITGLTFTYYPRSGFPSSASDTTCLDVTILCNVPFPLPFSADATHTAQEKADNIGRIHIQVVAQTTIAGQLVNRSLETDVVLKNRF